jgi:single-strand DNA-binding protein
MLLIAALTVPAGTLHFAGTGPTTWSVNEYAIQKIAIASKRGPVQRSLSIPWLGAAAEACRTTSPQSARTGNTPGRGNTVRRHTTTSLCRHRRGAWPKRECLFPVSRFLAARSQRQHRFIPAGIDLVGRDPELRYTSDGTPVCNFSVATTERRKDKSGELQEVATWFQVALFGRQAENVKGVPVKGKPRLAGRFPHAQSMDRPGRRSPVDLEGRGSDIKFLSGSGEKAAAATAALGATDDDIAF